MVWFQWCGPYCRANRSHTPALYRCLLTVIGQAKIENSPIRKRLKPSTITPLRSLLYFVFLTFTFTLLENMNPHTARAQEHSSHAARTYTSKVCQVFRGPRTVRLKLSLLSHYVRSHRCPQWFASVFTWWCCRELMRRPQRSFINYDMENHPGDSNFNFCASPINAGNELWDCQ